jgi:hypothetical protein
MAEDLAFPRLVYRGEADTLGSGSVGETARIDTQADLDAARKDGWRLTRELDANAVSFADATADEPAPKPAAKRK